MALHGGGKNMSDVPRIMYKLRIQPSGSQSLQWDTTDINKERILNWQRPKLSVFDNAGSDEIPNILMSSEPWFDNSGRLEYMNRIRFWRMLLNDPEIDIDYWLTRVENEPARQRPI